MNEKKIESNVCTVTNQTKNNKAKQNKTKIKITESEQTQWKNDRILTCDFVFDQFQRIRKLVCHFYRTELRAVAVTSADNSDI